MIETMGAPQPMPDIVPEMAGDFGIWEQQMIAPEAQLAALPHEGFTPEQRGQLIDQVVAVGLPVDNYTKLIRGKNDVRAGTEHHLGSWGTGIGNYGEFTIYELLDRYGAEIPEERLATIAHEGAHANTPLLPENAHLFGGETERVEAERFAWAAADQTLRTKRYLTGYHADLAEKLSQGKITHETFVEETQAIATELALTNRAKLEQVEAAQHAQLDRQRRLDAPETLVEPVNLLSRVNKDGVVAVEGIDRQLIALIKDVSDYRGLIDHVGTLKAHIYPEATLAVADARFQQQQPLFEIEPKRLLAIFMRYIREKEEIEMLNKKNKSKSKNKF